MFILSLLVWYRWGLGPNDIIRPGRAPRGARKAPLRFYTYVGPRGLSGPGQVACIFRVSRGCVWFAEPGGDGGIKGGARSSEGERGSEGVSSSRGRRERKRRQEEKKREGSRGGKRVGRRGGKQDEDDEGQGAGGGEQGGAKPQQQQQELEREPQQW